MKSIVYNIKELGSISSINLKKRETTTLLVILQILKLCILILSFLTVLGEEEESEVEGKPSFVIRYSEEN